MGRRTGKGGEGGGGGEGELREIEPIWLNNRAQNVNVKGRSVETFVVLDLFNKLHNLNTTNTTKD